MADQAKPVAVIGKYEFRTEKVVQLIANPYFIAVDARPAFGPE